MTQIASTPFSIQIQSAPPQLTGLDFPSNGGAPSSAFVAFQFINPQNDGLPFAGPSNQGCTYIWKYRPRQQNGYYATMWWSQNDGHFTHNYYGAHPYPPGGAGTSAHNWEVARSTLDITTTLAGSTHAVSQNVWHTQALRVTHNGNNTVTFRSYIQLPSVALADIIETTSGAGYGDTLPPSPALTFGDSPWYPDFGHERLSGILRGIKIFNKALTEADILSEAASDGLVTAAGLANIWWKKINPTPTNLLCEAGTGRNPIWAQATKAALWTG